MGAELDDVHEPEQEQTRVSKYGLKAIGGLAIGVGLGSIGFGVHELTEASQTYVTIYHGELLVDFGLPATVAGVASLAISRIRS